MQIYEVSQFFSSNKNKKSATKATYLLWLQAKPLESVKLPINITKDNVLTTTISLTVSFF